MHVFEPFVFGTPGDVSIVVDDATSTDASSSSSNVTRDVKNHESALSKPERTEVSGDSTSARTDSGVTEDDVSHSSPPPNRPAPFERSQSLGSLMERPVSPGFVGLYRNADDEDEDKLQLFESSRAILVASVLDFLFAFSFVGSAAYFSRATYEWIGVAAWHLSLWMLPHVTMNKPPTLLNRLHFLLWFGVLILQPHMDICRRVPWVGAAHGAASVIVGTRSLQCFLDYEYFKTWKPFRRMFFISAWGWHDVREARYVGFEGYLPQELYFLVQWAIVMLSGGFFLAYWGKAPASVLAQGNHWIQNVRLMSIEPLSPSSLEMAFFYVVRWFVGFFTLLAWFNVMDTFCRSMHFWATGHELRHISEDPWGARTLKDFWGRRWNVPVQDMLLKGVFAPIRTMKWLPGRKTIAKLAVFVVSGACHSYAISCGGMAWAHLASMFAFFMVQIPIIAFEDMLNMSGLGWMLGSQLPFAPLFIESCLAFVHL